MLLNVDESYCNDGFLIANKVYLIYLESRIIFIELILCYSGLIRMSRFAFDFLHVGWCGVENTTTLLTARFFLLWVGLMFCNNFSVDGCVICLARTKNEGGFV